MKWNKCNVLYIEYMYSKKGNDHIGAFDSFKMTSVLENKYVNVKIALKRTLLYCDDHTFLSSLYSRVPAHMSLKLDSHLTEFGSWQLPR